jgi:hypothetical protein
MSNIINRKAPIIMKKIILLTFGLIFSLGLFAQEEIDALSYDNTQDINFFKKIKNNTSVKKYITANNNIISIGDTLILGNPTSQELNSMTYSASYGNRARGGVSDTRSTTIKTYEFILMGKQAGLGNVLTILDGESPIMVDNSFKNTAVVVNEMKAIHEGSRKKPLRIIMILGEINGRAFGFNKYMSVLDTELALESGEILLKNRKMTREEAISKLKEAKELMEIEMMSKDEFEKLKKELRPIIRNNDN